MTDSRALIEARDDVLKKIGRNLVIFQEMEAMPKLVNAQQAISGSLSDLAQIAERAKQATSRLTMGKLVEAFLRSAYSSVEASSDHESPDQMSVTFSMSGTR
jgi:hypothetical protein